MTWGAPAGVGELLEAAQRQAWDLAVTLPLQTESQRVRTAAGQVRSHLAAWPALAAAERVLRQVPLDPAAAVPLTAAMGQLGATRVPAVVARDRGRDGEVGTAPHPRLERILFLGATF